MGRDLNRRFSKEDIQMVEKMLNIANNQRNSNLNNNEMSPHMGQNDCHQGL